MGGVQSLGSRLTFVEEVPSSTCSLDERGMSTIAFLKHYKHQLLAKSRLLFTDVSDK